MLYPNILNTFWLEACADVMGGVYLGVWTHHKSILPQRALISARLPPASGNSFSGWPKRRAMLARRPARHTRGARHILLLAWPLSRARVGWPQPGALPGAQTHAHSPGIRRGAPGSAGLLSGAPRGAQLSDDCLPAPPATRSARDRAHQSRGDHPGGTGRRTTGRADTVCPDFSPVTARTDGGACAAPWADRAH